MKKSSEQQTARDLFFSTDHSQAEIARRVGVDPKTMNLWVKHGKWKEIKLAARRTPAILVEQYFNQLAALNEAIDARDEGNRYPTLKEAETMRKLIVCINNIQKQVSVGASIDVMQNLITRIGLRDITLAQQVTDYAEEILQGREMNGIKSHEIAYNWGDEDYNTSPLERGQGCVNTHGDQSSIDNLQAEHRQSIGNEQTNSSPLERGQGCVNTHGDQSSIDNLQAEHRQSIGNEQALNSEETREKYPPKCTRDPDDPYTFYYYKITKRKMGSPKYGLPPDGFREVPKKDCVEIHHGKGFCRH
jgi:transposase-like protein